MSTSQPGASGRPRTGVCVAVAVLAGWLAAAAPSAALADAGDGGSDWKQTASVYGTRSFDALVLRPLGAGRVVVGFGFFVVSSPLTAIAGTLSETWETLVVEPYEFTVARPLGEL